MIITIMTDFGRELTLARLRAGLTIREVARATGLPLSTAGDYFSGPHLPPPGQPRLLEEILRVCGETDESRVREWTDALSRARRAPGKRAGRLTAPYRGLASFEPEDAPFFFGRADVTEQLVAMATGKDAVSGVPLTVVGPSGSGKSSLLRAGLVPRLLGDVAADGSPAASAAAARPFILLTPAAGPLRELAARLSELTASDAALGPGEIEAMLRRDPASAAALPLAGRPAGGPVIVADQFEAIFTDCPDEDERRAFIGAVCALSGPAVVAIALRSDFYDRALRYPELARALQDRQIVLGPMTQAQLRSAITGPARKAGLEVDDGLIEILLRDLAPAGAVGGPERLYLLGRVQPRRADPRRRGHRRHRVALGYGGSGAPRPAGHAQRAGRSGVRRCLRRRGPQPGGGQRRRHDPGLGYRRPGGRRCRMRHRRPADHPARVDGQHPRAGLPPAVPGALTRIPSGQRHAGNPAKIAGSLMVKPRKLPVGRFPLDALRSRGASAPERKDDVRSSVPGTIGTAFIGQPRTRGRRTGNPPWASIRARGELVQCSGSSCGLMSA
jgi:transcriptional regulator with XRE-family HTH domain/energy-coupling factor transporter ATP-binding protein EcfA2